MDDYPLHLLLVPIIGFAVVAWQFWRRRTLPKQWDQQYANYRASSLAQRLGLRVASGDPEFNFFIHQANADVARGPADKKPIHVEVRLDGAPRGLPMELGYLYRVEQESGLASVTWRTWFDCRMSVRPRSAFPPFEVVSRNAPMGPIVQVQPLPPSPTGHPSVDATYAVMTSEPAMARLLGELLPAFATFANSGVHLVGDGQRVSFVMKKDKAPLLANALYYAEQMSERLNEIAARIGG